MQFRGLFGLLVLGFGLAAGAAGAQDFDQSKYPSWKGQWLRVGVGNGNAWDPTQSVAHQIVPLTSEYQAIYDAARADEAAGGQGIDPTYLCVPSGMPREMIAVLPMEIIITPETTYISLELFSTKRRIYTDGWDFPAKLRPSFGGYSIGHWEDTTNGGRYDTLVVETRGLKGPHTYDSSGVPFHNDEQAILKERIFLDHDNPNILHNEVTAFDHALTRPWTVTRSYRRIATEQPFWTETYCTEDNHHVFIGKQNYVISGDGYLMPARKNEPPPDLRYFTPGK
jgi:hypothetical protein